MTGDPTAIDIAVDPTVQRMSGIAYHGNTAFDVPLISQIIGNLWQGGCQNGLVLPDHIVHVASLYPWERYDVPHALRSRLEVTMFDSTEQGFDGVDQIARWVNECRADGSTLVHCQAGLNRSALVCARALMLDPVMGVTAAHAIRLLRSVRSPAVLCNPAFEQWLLAHDTDA